MKRISIILLLLMQFALAEKAGAQGWCQDRSGFYSFGMGGTQAILVAGPYAYPAVYGAGFSLNISGEYKVQRFVGLGFQTGMDFFFGPPYARNEFPRYTAIGIPIALKVNIHILEAAHAQVADKLDVYAGLNLGGGPAFYTAPPGGGLFGFLQAGPQIGVRYWFGPHIGLFGELGWGATFANFGISF